MIGCLRLVYNTVCIQFLCYRFYKYKLQGCSGFGQKTYHGRKRLSETFATQAGHTLGIHFYTVFFSHVEMWTHVGITRRMSLRIILLHERMVFLFRCKGLPGYSKIPTLTTTQKMHKMS